MSSHHRIQAAAAGARASHEFAADAQASGQAGRFGWHARRGRAEPGHRAPDHVVATVNDRLVREVLRLVRRDGLVPWIEGLIEQNRKKRGAPVQMRLETFIVGCCLQAVTARNLHLINVPYLLGNLSPELRAELGVDIINRQTQQASQLTHDHVLGWVARLDSIFDVRAGGLTDEDRQQRADDLAEFANRIGRLAIEAAPYSGDYAMDATLKWAWARPPALAGKVIRRGADGDGGRPVALSDIVGDEPEPPLEVEQIRRPSRDPDAAWVGRANITKAVFGYQFATISRNDPTSPAFIERFAVAAANADAVDVILPALHDLHELRSGNPHTIDPADGAAIRKLAADPAYTRSDNVLMKYKDLGAAPIFKPHKKNQPALVYVEDTKTKKAGWALIHGRPACACCPPEIASLPVPPAFSPKEVVDHYSRQQARLLGEYAMKVNQRNPDGSVRYEAPHTHGPDGRKGGCLRCVNADGTPIIDPDTQLPRARCCTKRTKTFSAKQLARVQPEPVGTADWWPLLNSRNPVEGSYGILKNLALINWTRQWHHLMGAVSESWTFGFAVFAHNWHIRRAFDAAAALGERQTAPAPARPATLHPLTPVAPTTPTPAKRTTAALADLVQAPRPPT